MKYIKLKHSIMFGIPLMLAVLGIYLVVEFGMDLVGEDTTLKGRLNNIEETTGEILERVIILENAKDTSVENRQGVFNESLKGSDLAIPKSTTTRETD